MMEEREQASCKAGMNSASLPRTGMGQALNKEEQHPHSAGSFPCISLGREWGYWLQTILTSSSVT